MEFKYNKKKPLQQIFVSIYLMVCVMAMRWVFYNYIPDPEYVDEAIYLGIGLSVIMIVLAIRSYLNSSKKIVFLDDRGIAVTNDNGTTTLIAWEEVVNVYFKGQQDAGAVAMRPYEIVMESESCQLEVDEFIDGFPEIVQSIKNRFGERFDTRFIPLDLKSHQTKMKPMFSSIRLFKK